MTEKESDIRLPVTARIKMRRAEFCSVMFRLWGGKAVIILTLLLAVSLVLGIWSDMRFFIIILMVIFIMCPMILGFMYYYYGLGERCYFNVTEHTVALTDKGIRIDMYFPEYEGDTEAEDKEDKEKEERCVVKYFDYSLLHRYNVRQSSVIFPMGDKRINGFLWLPETAFSTPEDFSSSVKQLSGKLTNR